MLLAAVTAALETRPEFLLLLVKVTVVVVVVMVVVVVEVDFADVTFRFGFWGSTSCTYCTFGVDRTFAFLVCSSLRV